MNKLLFTLSLVVILGCSAAPVISTGARIAVNGYCAIPELGREAIRYEVAETLSPNKIVISCND